MFRHRMNGKKPSDAFIEHFKSKIWHPPTPPTWETFKLGEDVYIAADRNTSPSAGDVNSENRCSPRDKWSALLTPSFFDDAAFDFEESSLQPLDLSNPQSAGDSSFENVNFWDQIPRDDRTSRFSLPTTSSEWDRFSVSKEFGSSPDELKYLSLEGIIDSMQPERHGAMSAYGVDLYDQEASRSHSSKRSRFLTSINAPMACSHERGEEITYLDRDQAYLISISDSAPRPGGISPVKYRTSIQVSFETDEQRRQSAYHWNLWQSSHLSKDGTTASTPLKALEFAPSSAAFTAINQNVDVHLEESAVDRFTFTWTTMPSERPQCQVAASFHFVSTDFSQAKGVKGVSLRLSALTREITLASTEEHRDSQISHCLIKVYRNHGAERKTAIDSKQVGKKITKVKHQIANQENALRAKAKRDQPKRQKLSEDSSSQPRLPVDHMLVVELERLKMVESRPRIPTAFHLRGEPEDYSPRYTFTFKEDPNDFLKSPTDQLGENTSFLSMPWDNRNEITHPDLPPSKPFVSTNLPEKSQTNESSTFERALGMASPISNPTLHSTPTPSLVQAVQERKHTVKPVRWIKVIDADASYRSPEPLPPKAVLCLYVREFHPYRDHTTEDYYRVVYLKQRTVRELIACIADRCDFQTEPSKIVSAFHVSAVGKVTMIDDEFMGGIADEQDMNVELIQASAEDPKQSLRSYNSSDLMDICVEPDKDTLEFLNKWHLKLRY